MNEELLQSLPEEYAALADSRRVMREVAEELAELHGAATRLGDALEAAGLPGREWRSRDAALRLISRKLPDITVDRFITRLSEFAAGSGPDWLHGDDADLDRFHREVQAIYRVVARLREVVAERAPATERTLQEWAIERAFGDPQAMAALDEAAEILGDFRALRRFMAPLGREEWKSLGAAVPLETDLAGAGEARAQQETLPLPAGQAHSRLRDFARATMGPGSQQDGPQDPLLALFARARALLAPILRRRPLAVALAVVLATGITLLALHHPGGGATAPMGSQVSGTATSASVANTPVSEAATSGPIARPTATKPPTPVPQVTLACTLNSQGSSATLTIKNVGATSLTWQASASRWLTVSPSQGQLSVGQTTTAQVTPNSRHGWASNTVTVTATSGARSASYTATCG